MVSLMCVAYMSNYLITVVIVVLFGYSGGVLYLVEIHCFLLSTQPITNLLINTNLKITFCTTNRIYVVLPKNSRNLHRAPEPVVVCPSAARCG